MIKRGYNPDGTLNICGGNHMLQEKDWLDVTEEELQEWEKEPEKEER